VTASRRGWLLLAGFALAAVTIVGGVWWSAAEPPAPPRPAGGPAARSPDGIDGREPVPAGDRDEALDQIEAVEAEKLGAEEAARRRRQRERMLELRAAEH
jgi:hypothetical protein